MANTESVDITVYGQGAHGASPHMSIDPIVTESLIVMELQTIVSRNINPLDDAVITVGSFRGGTKHNIIPDEVKLQLTIRTYKDEVRNLIHKRIKEICYGIGASVGLDKSKWPKVTIPEQVSALVLLFDALEAKTGIPAGSLKMELMIETPQSILDSNGNSALPALVKAADGRCMAAHFGVYDYTASTNITAEYQRMTHPVCDFARHMMQVALGGTGIQLSDGATNIMPVGPHRPTDEKPLTKSQIAENRRAVYHAWRLNFTDIQHSLKQGYYQGWDLHPTQFPLRYAAVYSFFLESLESTSRRLKSFMEKAAQVTLVGGIFDDAATGQGLLNYFLRGISCGAITEKDAEAAGLTLEEIRTRSFKKILQGRQL